MKVSELLKFTSLEFCFGYRISLDQRWVRSEHLSVQNRLYCIREGSAEFYQDGRLVQLEAGWSYLLPAGRRTSYRCQESFALDWFHFEARLFGGLNLFDVVKTPQRLENPPDQLSYPLFDRLYELHDHGLAETEIESPAIIQQMLAPFLAASQAHAGTQQLMRLEPVLRFIENNISSPLRVVDLAEVLGLEESYFADLFSKALGVPPARYVMQRKIESARARLLTGSSCEAVARDLGFYDNSHFNRTFKKLVGLTPRQFARQPKEDILP